MGKIISAIIGVAIIIGGGALLRGQLNKGGGDEPLVNCETIPNPAPHDKEFHFYLDLNGKNKDSGNFELDSISVSDPGIALNSNAENLRLSGPFHAGLLNTVTVGKNTIGVMPMNDVRDKIEQEVLLHVAVKLKRKKGGTITTTSAICKATIIHARTPVVAPPVAQPKPKPPILYKDKSGDWVKPPTKELTKTPSFFTKYQKYVTDNMTQISVVVKPEDLAGRVVTGIEVALASRGYTLPAVARTSCNVNDVGWYKDDWNCTSTGAAVRCTGGTPLMEGKYSTIGIDFNGPINTPPPFLNAKLLDAQGNVVVGIGVPFVPVENE